MNASASKFDPKTQKTIIAVGHNEKCQTYALQLVRERKPSQSTEDDDTTMNDVTGGAEVSVPRRRRLSSIRGLFRNHSVEEGEDIFSDCRLIFKVTPLKSVQTDFNMPEPYQKVVRISPLDGKLMATGGDDGILRVWTFPELNSIHEIEAHDKEIDDIEFSPDQTKVISS